MAKRKSLSKRTRFEVLKRDGFACRYCGRRPPEVELVVDHVFPVASGGGNEMANLAAACRDCNLGKAASQAQPPCEWHRTMMEFQDQFMSYLRLCPQGRRLLAYAERLYGQRLGFYYLDHSLRRYFALEYVWGLRGVVVPDDSSPSECAFYRALPRAVGALERGERWGGTELYSLYQCFISGSTPAV